MILVARKNSQSCWFYTRRFVLEVRWFWRGQNLCRIGKVQMKTMDGGPVNRDANFLAETRCLTRDAADRFVHSKQPPQSSMINIGTDVPITIYSSALARQQYNAAHYGTHQYGSTTFGKHSNFTKIVGDYTRDPSDE